MRDVVWSSWTCTLTWHTKSAHRTTYKGEIMTTVHTPSATPNYMAVGTNFGHVRLHHFPCIPEESECHRFPSHCGSIANVRFNFDETHLLTAGLHDRTVVQWKAIAHDEDAEVQILDLPESEDFRLEARELSDLGEDFMPENGSCVDGVLNAGKKTDPKELQSSPSIDAWFESVVPPLHPPKQHTSIPDMSVKLEYCYGFTSEGLRNQIRYTKSGDVVFAAGTLGVCMTRGNRSQQFFQRHTDAITSFAVSKDGSLCATGQMGHEAVACVWDTSTSKLIATIPDVHSHSVSSMAFSNNMKMLVTVGLDVDHTVSVYEWETGTTVSRSYSGTAHVFDTCFSSDDQGLITCGQKDIKFWSGIMGHTPTFIRPALGAVGNLQPFLCCAYFAGSPLIGTIDGNLYQFVDDKLKTAVKAHDGNLSAMHVSPTGTEVVTGGKDGACRIWNVHLECTKEIAITSVWPDSPNPAVKSVAYNADGNNIIVGTKGAEILEVAVRSGALVGKPLLTGHGT